MAKEWKEVSEELIKTSFTGCGYCKNRFENIHSKLSELLEFGKYSSSDEPTGITDDEDIVSDDE